MKRVKVREGKCVICARPLVGKKSEIGGLVCTKKCHSKLTAFVKGEPLKKARIKRTV